MKECGIQSGRCRLLTPHSATGGRKRAPGVCRHAALPIQDRTRSAISPTQLRSSTAMAEVPDSPIECRLLQSPLWHAPTFMPS